MTRRKLDLTTWILLGLAAGIVCGLLQHWLLPDAFNQASVRWFHDPVGRLFLNAIRLMVVPLVIVSLTLGTAAIGDPRKLGRIGGKTMGLYLLTTAVAITIGLVLASVVRPGSGLSIPMDVAFAGRVAPPLTDTLVDIVPTNPFAAMVEGKMLQVICVALLMGLALAAVKDRARPLVGVLESLDAVIQRMVIMIMWIAPVGVFALIAKVIVSEGLAVFVPLLKYMGCVLGALVIHVAVVYSLLLVALARQSPLQFFRNIYPAMVVAFSTSSSNATLPVTMEVAERRLGTREAIHAFTLPLGATINMDGTAIMQGVATVFIAGVYGIDLSFGDFLQVILMATLASIGTAGVPGVGLIMLSMVLVEVGLPVEGIGIILGVDRLLDMSRTAVNIAGDLMCTTVVARSEGEFDPAVFGAENR
ncbi:MAG: dicarboxylate/amino acid:cation symporter [Candidatus Krumholzibacteriia bacterium]